MPWQVDFSEFLDSWVLGTYVYTIKKEKPGGKGSLMIK